MLTRWKGAELSVPRAHSLGKGPEVRESIMSVNTTVIMTLLLLLLLLQLKLAEHL